MKNIFLVVVASVFVIAVSIFSESGSSGLILVKHNSDGEVIFGVFLAGAMLLGILAGRIHKLIELEDDFHPKILLKNLLKDRHLWKSLVASPIVFGVIYSALSESNDVVVSLVFSFQNGFFCNAILESKKKEMEGDE
ncbi:hypothetical protein [Flammeovirga sp. SJP92]|uniref:hypothetical protein n=1 Tax=Flammeovirga sp. SJP92 TaxID=1775430 RepID=UPI000787275A|nr:hypothetical protein [Flammeovirga sp. SJP92]KXX66901.1 hypothetical protein AVL50_29795 [Flammeovirga sp. SJP92]